MRIAINATSAQMGGAVTYLRSVVPLLARRVAAQGDGRVVLWTRPDSLGIGPADRVEGRDPGPAVDATGVRGIARRLWFDQQELPRYLIEDRINALFSSANFGTLRSPVHQVLLVRNTLYFDPVLLKRIASRSRRAKYFTQRVLALRSIAASEVVLFPSRTMQDLAASYTDGPRRNWRVAPYGARLDMFAPSQRRRDRRTPTLLHVSLYSDQKNLGTLFTAMRRLTPRACRLRITAGLRSVENGPMYPNLSRERELLLGLEQEGIAEDLGPQPHASLPELYRSADLFVFPSYSESFGHPLVEAMASGLPIVAADTPINREVCADAAVYFEPFAPDACAEAIARVLAHPDLAESLASAGLARSREYTWDRHVDILWKALCDK